MLATALLLVVPAASAIGLTGPLRHRGLAAVLVTAIFAAVAHRVRAVNLSGAIAGAAVAFLLYLSAGPGAFLTLAVVFLVAWSTTRLGYARKRSLGTAESKHGRNAWQVLANLGIATALAVAAEWWERDHLLVGAVAALGEAGADTASSECGEALSDRVYLITNFARVPVGTDGGISLIGTVAGAAAAVLVATVAAAGHVIPQHWIALAAGCAFLGTLVDSLLGAALQRRGWLNNSTVNLLSTLAAAAISLLLQA